MAFIIEILKEIGLYADTITAIFTALLFVAAAISLWLVIRQIKQANSLKFLDLITDYFNKAASILSSIPHEYQKWSEAYLLIKTARSLKSKLMKKHLILYKCELDILRNKLNDIFMKIPNPGFFFFIEDADNMSFDEAKLKYEELSKAKGELWRGDLEHPLNMFKYPKLPLPQIEFFLQLLAPYWNYNNEKISKLSGQQLFDVLNPFYPRATVYYKGNLPQIKKLTAKEKVRCYYEWYKAAGLWTIIKMFFASKNS